jgi:hypothetical protein
MLVVEWVELVVLFTMIVLLGHSGHLLDSFLSSFSPSLETLLSSL